MTTRIESRQNPRIKELQKLTKRRRRDERGVTVVEGIREVSRALASNVIPIEAYLCPELVDLWPDQDLKAQVVQRLESLDAERHCHLFQIPPDLYEKITYRGESGGITLVVPYQSWTLEELPKTKQPFLLVVENLEKPGNLGAILRTVDAASVDGVIVAYSPEHSATDIYNPNAIRASLGTIFGIPITQASTAEVIKWLKSNKIQIVTTSPDSEMIYSNADLTGPVAVVMGSEAHGISDSWFHAADVAVTIPMHGIGDSLNLSTSTAIMLYEVVRQRALGAPK